MKPPEQTLASQGLGGLSNAASTRGDAGNEQDWGSGTHSPSRSGDADRRSRAWVGGANMLLSRVGSWLEESAADASVEQGRREDPVGCLGGGEEVGAGSSYLYVKASGPFSPSSSPGAPERSAASPCPGTSGEGSVAAEAEAEAAEVGRGGPAARQSSEAAGAQAGTLREEQSDACAERAWVEGVSDVGVHDISEASRGPRASAAGAFLEGEQKVAGETGGSSDPPSLSVPCGPGADSASSSSPVVCGDVDGHDISTASCGPCASTAGAFLEGEQKVAGGMGGSSEPHSLGVPCGPGADSASSSAQAARGKPSGYDRYLEAHVLFLQHCFRRSRRVRQGCWSRGGMRRLAWRRPVVRWGCCGGLNLATVSEVLQQKARARAACDWYQHYVRLLRRLSSGRTPTALVTYCSQGGSSEGVVRAGGAAHGQDIVDQPRYRARFGDQAFTKGDSTSSLSVLDLQRRSKAFLVLASPPCQAYSSAHVRGVAKAGKLIDRTRDVVEETGALYAIENVAGARSAMRGQVCLLRGAFFGEAVDRPRLFETNFEVKVDAALRVSGNRLRSRMCLGGRRRWRRMDPFGRPEKACCCVGNLWAPQGDKPLRCSVDECADAMGLDRDHMDYGGIAQAIPPVYSEYLFGYACMREVERRFRLPVLSYDDYLAAPQRASRLMAHWLRGAGGASPDQGVELVAGLDLQDGSRASGPAPPPPSEPVYSPMHGDQSGDLVAPASRGSVYEAEVREVFYSALGDVSRVAGSAAAFAALSPIFPMDHVRSWRSAFDEYDFGTWVAAERCDQLHAVKAAAKAAGERPGSYFVLELTHRGAEREAHRLGLSLVRRVRAGEPSYSTDTEPAALREARSFWAVGDVRLTGSQGVDYDEAALHMDPADRPGAEQEPKSAKAARSYMEIPWERERWDIGLPAELDEIMARHGVGIHFDEELGASEVPFYPWKSSEGLMKSIAEADRAILAGAMEYVPANAVSEVEAVSTVHPWTIVDQGGGKWRLCHDYSVGTNRRAPTASFVLPSVWDAAQSIRPGSYFAKYDIRDGFWHMPIAPDSRKRLVVRHPGTGRLMWASRLPFGYVDAPRLFCALTEALADRLRAQVAGKGIHYFVFVDDVLCVGDTEELTREGMRLLEAEFAARGVQWAPHKKRGPCQCIEFLGLLLCNYGTTRGVTVSKKRLDNLLREIGEWRGRRPARGQLEVEPRPLASLLGKLVFSSQVVRGGRTYMQGMLSQFKGLVVDWRRGAVSFAGEAWRHLRVGEGFWRDLQWWHDHLVTRSLIPFESEDHAEAVLAGTDASGWGTGQVLWLHGGREESQLIFTKAEKRRPINWRELLGIVRAAALGSSRLRGKTLLVETDNMAANGAVRKKASKAADMQELLRRLLRLGERFGFALKCTHTPGEKLDRPDQTSRGDSVEEPRTRLMPSSFTKIESRWGGFSSFIGAEREVARASSKPTSTRIWAHPTFSTVGSALRRVQETLSTRDGHHHGRALVLVPDDPRPAWNKALKHGVVVGRWAAGEGGFESSWLGAWRPTPVYRPMRLVLFPRSAGAIPRRLFLSYRAGIELLSDGRTVAEAGGYIESTLDVGFYLPVLPGSFMYSLPQHGEYGGLYRVVDATAEELAEVPDAVVGHYLLRHQKRASKQAGGGATYTIEGGGAARRWIPEIADMWTVDHLVSEAPSGANAKQARFIFDAARANDEIRKCGGAWSDATTDWTMVESQTLADETYAPFGSPDSLGPTSPDAGLEEIAGGLDALHLAQHPSKSGAEGVVPSREPRVRGGPRAGEQGAVRQECQYEGIACGGCGKPFTLGGLMESRGLALVHPQDGCRAGYDDQLCLMAERERDEATRDVFYGLYSDEVGVSGVYTSWAEVEALTSVADFHASWSSCASFAEAQAFVTEKTRVRAEASEGEVSASTKGGPSSRNVQLDEKLSDRRLEMIRGCIAGTCGRPHGPSTSTVCRGGCERKLHVVSCAQLAEGFAALGNFTCADCRVATMWEGEGEPSPEIKRVAERTMVLELGQGKESTAGGYADYVRLEEHYVNGLGKVLDDGSQQLRLPRHSAECFKNFLTWVALDSQRFQSIESITRTAGAMMVKLSLPDVTKSGDVKAHLRELIGSATVEHEPATTATPLMLKTMVEEIIPKRFADPFIVRREQLQVLIEGVGGCRIGEVAGAGEVHGLLANNVALLEDPEAPVGDMAKTVVEGYLEHSKTGYSRYFDITGCTVNSKLECAKILQDYWRLAGMKVTTTMQAGVKVTRPDFWVVRVNLLGLDATRGDVERLKRALLGSKSPLTKREVKSKVADMLRRHSAKGADKKFINVASGARDEPELLRALTELTTLGFEAQIVPGPLLIATTGGKQGKLKDMPLSVTSTFAPTKELLTKAWELVDKRGVDPDLDLEPGKEPKWTTHALRRLADTIARRYMEEMNVTAADIDIFMGWSEKVLKKAMQIHYASLSIRERMSRARITGMM
jgi:hypothetical protein